MKVFKTVALTLFCVIIFLNPAYPLGQIATDHHTGQPSGQPTIHPSRILSPTGMPSGQPSNLPTDLPTVILQTPPT
eukprot:gene13957-29708_t